MLYCWIERVDFTRLLWPKEAIRTLFFLAKDLSSVMKVIGYIRVSSDKQDLEKQEHLLLKYAQQHNLQIDEFIKVEISSRKDTKERRIDDLLKRLDAGDTLLVAELSRLGRNMFGVINIITHLSTVN